MSKVMLKGNEAVAEAAVRGGCDLYVGYPITPQSEVMEYLSSRMAEVGRKFIQPESELGSINMVMGAAAAGGRAMTSSSGPGFSLMQEGISNLAGFELPCVIYYVSRYGAGTGEIYAAQGDYWQATSNGGHGDYRLLVFAPGSIQELVDITYESFEIAEKHRSPVIILSDPFLGLSAGPVELPEMKTHDINKYDYVMKGNTEGEHKIIMNPWYYGHPYREMGVPEGIMRYEDELRAKHAKMMDEEQRWESVQTEDAEIVLVGYGISSKVCKEAIAEGRKQGLKLGLIRPISVSPFPQKAFDALGDTVKGFIGVEMSALGQMEKDIKLACECRRPVEYYRAGINLPEADVIIKMASDMLKK